MHACSEPTTALPAAPAGGTPSRGGEPLRLESVARAAQLRAVRVERLAELVAAVSQSAGWWAHAVTEALGELGFARCDRTPSDAAYQGLARWTGSGARGALWLEVQARCWREYGRRDEVVGLALELSAPSATVGKAPQCLGVALLHRCGLTEPLDGEALQVSLLQLEPEQVLAWVQRHRNG